MIHEFDKKESYSYYLTSLSWSYARRKSEVYLSPTYFQCPINVIVDEYEKTGISFRLIKDRQNSTKCVSHFCLVATKQRISSQRCMT